MPLTRAVEALESAKGRVRQLGDEALQLAVVLHIGVVAVVAAQVGADEAVQRGPEQPGVVAEREAGQSLDGAALEDAIRVRCVPAPGGMGLADQAQGVGDARADVRRHHPAGHDQAVDG